MKLVVEVTSTETIKPSTPTSDHLHHYYLSFIDQLTPSMFNSIVLFYSNDDHDHGDVKHHVHEFSNKLKTSLSHVLTHYYPLAGRHVNIDDVVIECNDNGVLFLEAEVKSCKLSDVLDENPNPNELNKFVPFKFDEQTQILMAAQFNIFKCGGIALGLSVSHKISDALSLFTFIKTWATIARGESIKFSPIQLESSSAKLFPPKDLAWYSPGTLIPLEDVVITKSFVFDASAIEDIREKYAHNLNWENQKPVSRVEALSAFIWSRFVSVIPTDESKKDPKTFHTIFHMVNLRPKIDPPQPLYSFGNLYGISTTTMYPFSDDNEHNKIDCSKTLLKQVREEMNKMDKNFVKKMQEDGEEYLDSIKKSIEKFKTGKGVSLTFSSLCRMPMYEGDFGWPWGKPKWVGSPARSMRNSVVFLETQTGGGIETHISLVEDDMKKLEADDHFRQFVHAM